MESIKTLPYLLTILLLLSFTGCSNYVEYVTDSIEDEAEERVYNNTDQAIEEGFNQMENAVKCAATNQACIDKAKKQGKPVVVTDSKGNVVKKIPGEKKKQGIGNVNANYDFKPGERTLFATDFSDAVVGNFPRKLEFSEGAMAVVKWNGRRWLRAKEKSMFAIPLGETLPKRFTISFDIRKPNGTDGTVIFTSDKSFVARNRPIYYKFNYFLIGEYQESGVYSGYPDEMPTAMGSAGAKFSNVVTARIMADGSYAKVYINKTRVANIPNAKLIRENKLWLEIYAYEDSPVFITDIRVAAGGKDLYSTLESEGRVALQGIHFAKGASAIQPASEKTLKKIADLLKEHTDLNLLIEGHTSNTGSYETNMKLSKERAAAVKSYLVANYGIDASRLKTNGLGSTQPVASNETKKGRAKNRRVEVVKL